MNSIGATSLTGAAGEHLVMSRLLSRGLIAALAPQGVPYMDIVVTSTDGRQLRSIQVKTRWEKGADGGWHMGKKHEDLSSPRMFCCFVDLGRSPSDQSIVYVLPSIIVAEAVRDSHRAWLSNPGRNGRVRNDSKVRRLVPDHSFAFGPQANPYPLGWLDRYREAWHLLTEQHRSVVSP